MLEYLEALSKATTLEEVWKLHLAKMASYGFDRVVYGFTRFHTEKTAGPIENALVLSNHEPVYFKRFMEEEHYLHAPLFQWALNNAGGRNWSYIKDDYDKMTKEQKRVVDLNIENNVIAGYSLSFHTSSMRARGVMALTAELGMTQSEVNALWNLDGREIEVICNMAHLKFMSLPHTSVQKSCLSKRQLEVLEWVAEGKTNQDIATIMNLSPATIEKHLRLARENLNVETTAQAVLKATFQNQIFVVPT